MTILLASDVLDGPAYDQIAAFSYFVSDLRRQNIPGTAFPPELLALGSLQAWVGEVQNGGNSQFVGNKRDLAEPMLDSVRQLLRACGAETHASIVERVLHWIRGNPAEAALQTGFSGGIAPELAALDAEFWAAERASSVLDLVAKAMLARPDVRFLPQTELKAAREAEAKRLIEASPEIQRSIVRSVAKSCRAWLSDPWNMGMALASGKADNGIFVSVGLKPVDLEDGTRQQYVCLAGRLDDKTTRNIGHFLVDQSGLRFIGDPEMPSVDIFVSSAEIRRAIRMALAFRLPESVGLRWLKMGRPFSVGLHRFAVMPGANWRPNKWRIMWAGDVDWAVKGSPNRSTFAMGPGLQQTETLMQDDIAARLEALWLRPGG